MPDIQAATATRVSLPAIAPAGPAAQHPAAPAAGHGVSFHDILSALNPLQYLPVVGTIYRVATGDVIPEGLRYFGSLLVSGLLGGPMGIVTSIATTIAEKATGIDPEKIIASQFGAKPASGQQIPPPGVVAAIPVAAATTTATTPTLTTAQTTASPAARGGWTRQQLAAYGVTWNAAGTPRLGRAEGADVFNSLELLRHSQATAIYAANQAVPPTIH